MKTEVFPLRTEAEGGTLLVLGTIALEVVARAIRQEKGMKRHPNWKRRHSISVDDMSLHAENPVQHTQTLIN